ncbi:hypothetical protein [Neptuniibacter sp. QD34_54]|uniref:hypothetical protein n=1 Tax=Neptuniibacter sp. QD34_54 TaxID=3398208 RepID=UPI0039F58A05
MIKVLVKGFFFGIGFSIAVAICGFIGFKYFENQNVSGKDYTVSDLRKWNKLSPEEQMNTASAIALISYSAGENSKQVASISKLYKQSSNIQVHYDEGDLYPKADITLEENMTVPEGAIVLFMGSPANGVSTSFIYNNRIRSLGDISVTEYLAEYEKKHNK